MNKHTHLMSSLVPGCAIRYRGKTGKMTYLLVVSIIRGDYAVDVTYFGMHGSQMGQFWTSSYYKTEYVSHDRVFFPLVECTDVGAGGTMNHEG